MATSLAVLLLVLCATVYLLSCGFTVYCSRRGSWPLLLAYVPGMGAIAAVSLILPSFGPGVQLAGIACIFWTVGSLAMGTISASMGRPTNYILIAPWSLGVILSYPLIRAMAHNPPRNLS